MPEFTPPYMYQGLYATEARRQIEAANRATLAAIFERREQEQRKREWMLERKRMHDSGIHTYGFCPWCPASTFYD